MTDAKIEITCRHGSLSERTKSYAEEKVAKLQRFHDRVSRAHLVFDAEGERGRFLELVVHVDNGRTFVAKEHGDHARETIDLLVDKMEAQLRKDKEKLKAHHKPGGKKALSEPEPADRDEPTLDQVIDTELKSGKKKRP